MKFETWMRNQYQWDEQFDMEPQYSQCDMEAAWNASRALTVESIQAMPHRAMFDSGVNQGRKEAATEIIQFIVDQGTIECGKDDPYFVVQDDLVILREKFGLEI